tara:strand:+ start:2837 stop:3448 length:612 start_codon:yes stop_codon:yes gene_type:complete
MKIISRKEAKALGLKYYFTGKPCKQGHTSEKQTKKGYCCECARNQSKKYAAKNKEKISEGMKAWRSSNKEHISNYNASRKDKLNEWVANNPERVREIRRNYKKRNPMLVFTRGTLERLERRSDARKYESLLGYTQEDFINHIESQFGDGMSWGNRSEWHIDHIRPIKSFLDEGITDPKIINALANLQPLWAHENRSKGAKYEQ